MLHFSFNKVVLIFNFCGNLVIKTSQCNPIHVKIFFSYRTSGPLQASSQALAGFRSLPALITTASPPRLAGVWLPSN